eukprot:g14059.t1
MVHLSSAIPTEVQGKLSALMDSYLRPVLVERRLPTGYCQALDRGLNTQAMLEDEEPEQETGGTAAASSARVPPRERSKEGSPKARGAFGAGDEGEGFCWLFALPDGFRI